MVTLFHHSLPPWAGEYGGWKMEKTVDYFMDFTRFDFYPHLMLLVNTLKQIALCYMDIPVIFANCMLFSNLYVNRIIIPGALFNLLTLGFVKYIKKMMVTELLVITNYLLNTV